MITNKTLIIKCFELPGGQPLARIKWVIITALLELLVLTATPPKNTSYLVETALG